MKPITILRHLVRRMRSLANASADRHQGPNLYYTLAGAMLRAFACFFPLSPSFLAFQRSMQKSKSRSHCQTLAYKAFPPTGRFTTFR